MTKFHNGLVEAYIGFYECEEETAKVLISEHDNKRRLQVYCEWNGIIGYAGTLFDIATTGGEYAD